jgi:glycosyltransferase involved in cell wall biosynthesis
MRILLIHQYFLEDNEGGGARWNEMCRFWIGKGHEITVLAGMIHTNGLKKPLEYKGKFFCKKTQNGVEVIRCHVSEFYNTNFVGRLWGYFSFVLSCLWAGLFKTRGKFDFVIVTSPPLFIGISGYIISRIKKIPFVFEVRDLWPESAVDAGVVKSKTIIKIANWLEAFIYKKAKLINVLTPAFKENLIRKKSISEEKIIFIPNAADFELSDVLLNDFDNFKFRKENNLSDKFVITYVGAHGIANHLEQILETAALLKGTNVLFLLIGQGMEKQKLKKMAKDMELANVRFLDSVPKSEVFKYILSSDMGTSVLKKVDAFKTVYSNKTFDYMSCKKPILMAIDGVSRELVEEAKAGIFINPEDALDFKNKIMLYLNNPQKIEEQGKNGYSYAKKHFDRNVLANKFLVELENIF